MNICKLRLKPLEHELFLLYNLCSCRPYGKKIVLHSYKHFSLLTPGIHVVFVLPCSQDGQNPGPPPLIPGLGQQGGQGRLGPHNQGPGLNKGNLPSCLFSCLQSPQRGAVPVQCTQGEMAAAQCRALAERKASIDVGWDIWEKISQKYCFM